MPYRQQSGVVGVQRCHADLGVDVEQALLTAWRPDSALKAKLIRLQIVVVVGAVEGLLGGDLVVAERQLHRHMSCEF